MERERHDAGGASDARAIAAAVFAASLDAIIAIDHRGLITEFNPAAERMFGLTRAAVVGASLEMIIPERLRAAHRRGLGRYVAAGTGVVVNRRIEMPALRADGVEFPVELAIVPVEGAAPPAFIGFLRDLTEAKRAEARERVMKLEIAHRSRNLLTVVGAIAMRTITEDRSPAEMREALSHRIASLGRSHAALASGGGRGAEIGEIVRSEVAAFSRRVAASGPAIMLSGSAAQTFALVAHELATNAVKYGALSNHAGLVAVGWTIEGEGDGARLLFRWTETGGPPARPPARKGFGRSLLEDVVAAEFGAPPRVEFAETGLVYECAAPPVAFASAQSD